MKILTTSVYNTEFIKLQYETLKKYIIGDYEFIVFNDAKKFSDWTNDGDITVHSKIEECCKSLNIQCINIPNDHHSKVKEASTIDLNPNIH
jgi:hypothetical protein